MRPVPPCPVCLSTRTRPFRTVGARDYARCTVCLATFLHADQRPDARTELARYRKHENDPNDPGYRRFLSQLARPLLERLAPGLDGLDYGCGPGPALAAMLAEAGHHVRLYDPFFRPDRSALERTYDFITCTETAEHFHRPADEFATLDGLLLPGGWMGIMTCFLTDDRGFPEWNYRTDPTHVVFYREETFRRLAARFGWSCEIPSPNVVLLRKQFLS
jgi:SAM-dependent methyltransferase